MSEAGFAQAGEFREVRCVHTAYLWGMQTQRLLQRQCDMFGMTETVALVISELSGQGWRKPSIFHNRVGIWYFQVDPKNKLSSLQGKSLISLELKKIKHHELLDHG